MFIPQTFTEHLQVARASVQVAEAQGLQTELPVAARHEQAAEIDTEQPPALIMLGRLTSRQTVLPISVKLGLAVAAEAGGVVSAEGVPGARLVVVFTGLLVGSSVQEVWKVKQARIKGLGNPSILDAASFVVDTVSAP